MNQAFARLSSMERRFVVGVGVVFFVVLNIWWVWPHYGDWTRTKTRMANAHNTLTNYVAVTNGIPKLEEHIRTLESESAPVPADDQARDFALTIMAEAQRSGVNIPGNTPSRVRPSQFFSEQIQTVPVSASETNLVAFLYNLGSGGSMIRVKDFSLKPDPPRYQLGGNITLVASYQNNPLARPAAKTPAVPAAKSSTPTKK